MRIVVCAVLIGSAALYPSVADACGQPKKHLPPQCQPVQPTPVATVIPTTIPTPVPTVAPTPVPTPPPPVAQLSIVRAEAVPSSGGGGFSPRAEWCHYEPSTQQWEIRHSPMQPGDRSPVEAGLCAQDVAATPTAVPTPVPTAIVVEEVVSAPIPENPEIVPTAELVERPPVAEEVAPPEWMPETPDFDVPVQVP